MQLNKNQVIEINLKDLFFHILYRWRSLLVVALIGAIVLCGYQYLTIKIAHDAGKQTKEERQFQLDLQDYKENLESAQNTIRVNTKLLQGQNTYRNESIYFQLDPQKVWVASNKYLVKVDQSVLDKLPQGSTIDPADSILSAYSSPLSETTDDELKEAFGTEKPEYVSELVSVTSNVNDNTITVIVKGAKKETAQTGLALLDSKMKSISTEKAQGIDPHTLTLVSEDISITTDEDLVKKQDELAKQIKENQENLQKARQDLDKLDERGEPKTPGQHLVRMAVIGFVLGAAILAFIYAVLFILKGGLSGSRDFSNRYKLPVFGEYATPGWLHSNKGLDKLFATWELGKSILNDDALSDNIAALVAENREATNVLLVSTLPTEKLNAIKEALTKRLPEKNIEVQADATRNSNAITEASKADVVIMAEAKNVSRLKNIDRVAENLVIAKANVIGAIIL